MLVSDTDNVVDPVQGVLKAFRKGMVLTRRICKAARNAPAASQMLDTIEPAQTLERSLVYSESQIKDTYQKSVEILGQGYPEAILNDPVITNKLQGIAIKLMEEILAIDEYIDDPDSFDLDTFQRIQRESETYCGQVIHTLGILQQQLLGAGLGLFKLPDHNDREVLPSMRRTVANRPMSGVSPMRETPAYSFSRPIISETHRGSTPTDNSAVQMHAFTGTSYGSYESELQVSPLRMRPTQDAEEPAVKLIDSRDVARQMSENEELLEKRRRSRLSFYQDLSKTRQSSLNSNSPNAARIGHSFASPILGSNVEVVQSPLPTSRPNSMLLTASNVPQEGQPRPSLHTRISQDRFSTLPERYEPSRHDSSNSEPMFFGPLDSPPLSSGHQSAADGWGGLATTLKIPGFGMGVVEGKEVVNQLVSDPGIIPVNEDHNEPTPATSVQSVDYPMRPDSSFYQYGGFCDGARMLLKGDKGALVTIRKPGVSETFSALISKKCVKCSYEVDFDVYDKDTALDPSGIYTVGEIRFRMRFLSKCHLPAKHTHDPAYACIFCIEDGKTVDDYDATIFFSVSNFFRHLQKHPRPVKTVEGITVLYGLQADAVDFDIHFKTIDPRASSFCDMATKFSSLPTAHATTNHRERAKGFKDRDPDGRLTLQFALGARIVGLEYPPRFNGDWCYGYHDGDKGHFPASAICLDPPTAKDDIVMYDGSTLSAIAKWDHKPQKDNNGTWLRFSKKERISKIGYPYPEAWCWTGQNAKGKWGIFPASFVTGVAEGAEPSSGRKITRQPSADASKSSGGGMFSLSKLSSHGFQRRNTGDKLSGSSGV